LPAWADLYDYAARVEYLGVGVWANKLAAPDWTAAELSAAFMAVLDDHSPRAKSLRTKAKDLGDRFDNSTGSACSAREMAALARRR
jgi:UDP:flavonoid glycosyltransferase YjiC (YdhE family)